MKRFSQMMHTAPVSAHAANTVFCRGHISLIKMDALAASILRIIGLIRLPELLIINNRIPSNTSAIA